MHYIALAASLLSLVAGAEAEPRHIALEAPFNVWDVAVADMNGDGLQDTVAFCAEEDSDPLNKQLLLYLGSTDSGFGGEAAAAITVAPETGAAFIAETNGSGRPEVVVTSPRGASIYAFEDGKFEKTGETQFNSLLPGRVREPRFLTQSAQDLNGDGIDEWLIPAPLGYDVRSPDSLITSVECDVISEIRSASSNSTMIIMHRLPDVQAFEVPGKDQKALAFLTDEFADFAYGENWSEHSRFEIPLNLEEKWDTNAQMRDLNNDDLPDIVVTQTEGTLSVTVLTQIYMAEAPFTYSSEPSATFQTKGAFATPVIMDVNGDEKQDVLYLKVPFGISFFANLLLRKKVKFDVEVYLYEEERYGEKPNYTTGLAIDAPDGREQVAYTLGDFNGDGRIDGAFGSGDEELVVHLGEEDRLIGSRAWKTFNVAPFGDARAHKLDDNEREDIVIFHPAGELKKTIDVILF